MSGRCALVIILDAALAARWSFICPCARMTNRECWVSKRSRTLNGSAVDDGIFTVREDSETERSEHVPARSLGKRIPKESAGPRRRARRRWRGGRGAEGSARGPRSSGRRALRRGSWRRRTRRRKERLGS
eukprot:2172869-Rhodomonas_salina.3